MKRWKSSRSAESANCVALVADETVDIVALHDTKAPPWLLVWFDREVWRQFIAGVKDGEFDR